MFFWFWMMLMGFSPLLVIDKDTWCMRDAYVIYTKHFLVLRFCFSDETEKNRTMKRILLYV